MQSLSINFKGITNIYSLTDTHQDTRKTRTLLSETVNTAQKNNNVLLLNCGDMLSEAASLVEVVHGVRVTPSLAFCGSDPMHLLPVPVPDLLAKMNLFIAQVHQVVGVS